MSGTHLLGKHLPHPLIAGTLPVKLKPIMFKVKSLLIVALFAVSTSLFGQPSVLDIVLYSPTIVETMDQVDVINTYTAPVAADDEAHVLTPSGNVAATDAGKLAEFVYNDGQAGIYRFYFPLTGLRTKLIVD
jgi:hypothetical protein